MKYTYVGNISRGGFGRVDRCQGEDGTMYAIKTFDPHPVLKALCDAEKLRLRFVREVQVRAVRWVGSSTSVIKWVVTAGSRFWRWYARDSGLGRVQIHHVLFHEPSLPGVQWLHAKRIRRLVAFATTFRRGRQVLHSVVRADVGIGHVRGGGAHSRASHPGSVAAAEDDR